MRLEGVYQIGILREGDAVQVFGKNIIEHAKSKYPRFAAALDRWVILMEGCKAQHPPELKQTFGDADIVPPHTVFDISGNHLRLIAKVAYKLQHASVTHVLTHKEYDEGKWKK
jgi:mRNA interferase HigB